MPLSKKRNAELMRKLRYNRRLVASTGSNSVVPKLPQNTVEKPRVLGELLPVRLGVQLNLAERIERDRVLYKKEHGIDPCVDILPPGVSYIDADGNIVYE